MASSELDASAVNVDAAEGGEDQDGHARASSRLWSRASTLPADV
jgi:hypothetical protein